MVSGASRGIGRAVVERLLAAGFLVSAGVRDARGLAGTDTMADVTALARAAMTQPADLAALIETLLRLPGNAAVAELLVNCRHEDML